MKTRSLQSKLFIAYLGMACLILFSFAIFFYVFASGQLKKSQISAMSTLNSTFQSQVDSAIQNLDTVSVNINYSNMSKSVLDQKFDLNISDEMLSAMSDLFISLSGTELKADQVNLYDFSGYVLQAGLSTMVKKSNDSHNEWIQKAREANGKKVLTAPYSTYVYSKSARYPQWFISLYRSFTNQYGRGVGVIETAKQCKSIFKSIISYEKKNHGNAASVYVFNDSGDLIYPYDITADDANDISKYYKLTDSDQDTHTESRHRSEGIRLQTEFRIYRLHLSDYPAGICDPCPCIQNAEDPSGCCCCFSCRSSNRFLQAFPLCSKTGETPEAHYPAYGIGHSRPGKSHFLSGFRQ